VRESESDTILNISLVIYQKILSKEWETEEKGEALAKLVSDGGERQAELPREEPAELESALDGSGIRLGKQGADEGQKSVLQLSCSSKASVKRRLGQLDRLARQDV
jgi:hypothetical protein